MEEFKVGDRVVRAGCRDGSWRAACAFNNVDVAVVCTVSHVWEGSGDITVSEVIPQGGCLGWSSYYFRHADAAELELPVPDHGDSPTYDLLATISRLEYSVEQYREHVAELERDLDTRSQQLDVAMRRNNTLADQLDEALKMGKPHLELVVKQLSDEVTDLQAQLGFANTLVQESDAAGAAAEADLAAAKAHAKQLAADLEYSRHSWRLAQYHLTQVRAVLGGVACTLHTVNLGELASQLRGVAAGLESMYNGADAALVRRAGNLLDLFNMAIVDGKRQ